MSKEGADFLRTLIEEIHKAGDSIGELGLVGGNSLTGKVLLEIVVEVLLRPSVECPPVGRRNVRIQFRAVGGKIMHLDPVLVFLQPSFHPFRGVDSQVVDDENEVLRCFPLKSWHRECGRGRRWV